MLNPKFFNIIKILPFVSTCGVVLFYWYMVASDDYIIVNKFIITSLLLFINIIIYFIDFRLGLVLSFIILLLSSFLLIIISLDVMEQQYTFTLNSHHISTPKFNPLSFMLFLAHLVLNRNLFKRIILNWINLGSLKL